MKTYTLTFDATDLKVLSMAIGEVPTKLGKPLLDKINSQIAQQVADVDAPFGVGSAPAASLNTGS